MKNAIITCCDSNCEKFLVNHWYKSLTENVSLKNIQIVVIDYGLTADVVKFLKSKKVDLFKAVRDGYPTTIRLRDTLKLLKTRKFNQVMIVDGGDVIFQSDISPLFERHTTEFRAVEEEISPPFEKFFTPKCFDKKNSKIIMETIIGNRQINGGVLIAPQAKIISLYTESMKLIKNFVYGADQVILNYVLHRDGFVPLDFKYNFLPVNTLRPLKVKDGRFYTDGALIPLMHNAAGRDAWRVISNFGYGMKYNKINKFKIFLGRSFSRIMKAFR